MHAPSLKLLAWLLPCPAAPFCDDVFLVLRSTPNMPCDVAASMISCLQHNTAPLPECVS